MGVRGRKAAKCRKFDIIVGVLVSRWSLCTCCHCERYGCVRTVIGINLVVDFILEGHENECHAKSKDFGEGQHH